jgi:hypothetical protein
MFFSEVFGVEGKKNLPGQTSRRSKKEVYADTEKQ